MNQIYKLIILAGLCALLSAQSLHSWTEPFSVTQPVGENINPRVIAGSFGADTSGLIFWERELNDSTTAIMLKALFPDPSGPEAIVLSENGVKYKNASAWVPWGADSIVVVVTVMTSDSNQVIWGKIPLLTPLTDTVFFNQRGVLFHEFQTVEYELLDGKLAAILDGDVLWMEWNSSTDSFSIPERIASGDYESPTVQYNRLECVQHL